jgi:glyoxylase-like metal-dependent hydrolase (beta-lactamase superfamily II)
MSNAIYTEDRKVLFTGDAAFDYYGMKPGVIGKLDNNGWFDFDHDDGTKTYLDGSRICSMEFAAKKGWLK